MSPGRTQLRRPGLRDSPRVLVVDDDELMHARLGPMLERAGCQVESAMDGSTALSLIQTKSFDMVLMDLNMPHMDGIVTMRLMRALGNPASNLPIIIMSARFSPEDRQRLHGSGAYDFMSKPVDFQFLVKLLQRHLPHMPNTVAGEETERISPDHIPPALYDKFIVYAQSLLKDVDAALEPTTSNIGQLQESAHKMAGIASLLGEPELGERASQVDLGIAKSGRVDNSDIQRLRSALMAILPPHG